MASTCHAHLELFDGPTKRGRVNGQGFDGEGARADAAHLRHRVDAIVIRHRAGTDGVSKGTAVDPRI